MKTTHEDYFEKSVAEWAAADAECRRLYMLWNTANVRARKLARIKNEAWRLMNAAKVAEFDRAAIAKSNGDRA